MLPVFVIHWNAPDRCAETVASLLASTGLDIAVTVIDNASERLPLIPSGVSLEQLPTNVGYSGAANRALALARDAPLAVIASHDVEVAPTCLAALRMYAADHPGVGIVGPDFGPDTIPDRWLQGSLMLLRRECVDDVGQFDEIFGSYFEEVDYCHRALACGWSLAIAPCARASTKGRMHPELAGTLMDANFTLLATKERRWADAWNAVTTMLRSRRWRALRFTLKRLAQLAAREALRR